MAINRQKLIHFHGAGAVTSASTLTDHGFVKGEIAVRHGADALNSELYILDNTGALVTFASAAKVAKDIADAVKVETDARIEAVSGVTAAITAETSAREAAISGVTEAYKAADDVVRDEFAAADTALETKITSAYTAADAAITKTVNDMDAAYKAADEDLQGQVDAIVEEIGLKADETDGPTGLHKEVADAEAAAKAHAENQVKALAEGAVSANTAAIAAEVKRAGDKETELQGAIEEVAGDLTEAISTLEGKITAAGKAATTKVVEGTDNGHLAISGATAEDGSVTYTITLTDVASDAEFKPVKTAVETLVGSDANMSARAIVQDEVTKQLTSENISESFDTLREMAEWLSSHPEDVTAMNNAIEALENKVGAGVEGTTLTAEIARVEGECDKAIEDMDAAYKAAITGATAAITSAYTAADSALETKITSAYTAADAILQGAIDAASKAVEDEVEARETAISGVTSAYEAADAILRQAIADEESARKTAISGVTDEIARVEREYKAADKGITDRLDILEGNGTATAVQEVVVSNLTGVEAVKSGTTVTINYANMVIDCGSWE